MILETPRLILREMTILDAENAYLLNADPEVIQYTGDEAFESIKQARVFLSNYTHYEQYGFGRWAVINKADFSYLGFCGLKYTPELDEYDIGYRLIKKYWGNGYATESAKACIDYGFNSLNMTTIVGRARYENKASIRVLEKIGLQYYGDFDMDGFPGVIYRIDK